VSSKDLLKNSPHRAEFSALSADCARRTRRHCEKRAVASGTPSAVDLRETIKELSMKVPSRRFWVRSGLVLVLAFVAIQFVPYGRSHVNPLVVAEPSWDSPDTRALARQACFDCHSNETEWPAYSRVAPVSWLIQHDVSEGRAVLNFSEWQRPQEEATEAAEEVMEGEMPLRMYQLMHAHARLNAADRERLARGLTQTLGRPAEEARADR
jgi:mono/diheme cytochrome c family protein